MCQPCPRTPVNDVPGLYRGARGVGGKGGSSLPTTTTERPETKPREEEAQVVSRNKLALLSVGADLRVRPLSCGQPLILSTNRTGTGACPYHLQSPTPIGNPAFLPPHPNPLPRRGEGAVYTIEPSPLAGEGRVRGEQSYVPPTTRCALFISWGTGGTPARRIRLTNGSRC